jgi:hypothetical protein
MLSEAGTKYGEGTIKKWSIVFTEKYGKGYSLKNLWRMRQFYFNFSKVAPMGRFLNVSYTNHKTIIALKEENKHNYYLNIYKEI